MADALPESKIQNPKSKIRFALLGAGGQLATALAAVLPGDVVPLSRADADLCDFAAIDGALDAAACDVVINTAAFNLVDQAEDERKPAWAVNAFAPKSLANHCAARGRTLVHISTDYVFGDDASRSAPYTESDLTGPLGAYAASKLAGEQHVSTTCPQHFIVRTCGLYGPATRPGKRNFVLTMLKLATEREKISVVNDQRCTPTFTRDLAGAIVDLIATGQYGLYHATNSGSATWYEFACEIFRQTGRNVRVVPISSAAFGAKAKRPAYSVLDCSKLAGVIGRELRPWQEALAEYLREIGA